MKFYFATKTQEPQHRGTQMLGEQREQKNTQFTLASRSVEKGNRYMHYREFTTGEQTVNLSTGT